MLQSVVDQISKAKFLKLLRRSTVLQESLLASVLSKKNDITLWLSLQQVELDLRLACRFGATDLVIAELRILVNTLSTAEGVHGCKQAHYLAQVDRCFEQLVRESLSATQLETCKAVWDELVAFSLPPAAYKDCGGVAFRLRVVLLFECT
ncbi:GPI-anchored surface protein, putative [Bodo saltans]|uniref:GPI-anchored surface protein, putative n=1 Tax=Bodo saltans TaxID=75058 RepID=A0A0S4J3W7_BODSA|nr:GPI-anchored surface protein, putative [Bodo saltans]|eukprot:CUG77503.1 GPI-anchored surface protein, putative [Bodo saltans]